MENRQAKRVVVSVAAIAAALSIGAHASMLAVATEVVANSAVPEAKKKDERPPIFIEVTSGPAALRRDAPVPPQAGTGSMGVGKRDEPDPSGKAAEAGAGNDTPSAAPPSPTDSEPDVNQSATAVEKGAERVAARKAARAGSAGPSGSQSSVPDWTSGAMSGGKGELVSRGAGGDGLPPDPNGSELAYATVRATAAILSTFVDPDGNPYVRDEVRTEVAPPGSSVVPPAAPAPVTPDQSPSEEPPPCPNKCNGVCVNIMSDKNACGAECKVCRKGQQCVGGGCIGGGRQFVVELLQFPHAETDYAIDLDGDGEVDNNFAAFLQTFARFNDLERQININIDYGVQVIGIDFPPDYAPNDPVTIFNGMPTLVPDFWGMGRFIPDPTVAAALFLGVRTPTSFVAKVTPKLQKPTTLTMQIKSSNGGPPIDIPLECHDMSMAQTGFDPLHWQGDLHGSIPMSYMKGKFIDQIVDYIQWVVSPKSNVAGTTQNLLTVVFDSGVLLDVAGKVLDPNRHSCDDKKTGMPSVPNDKRLDDCEIRENPFLLQFMPVPDLRVYNDLNQFEPMQKPLPKKDKFDSVSFGLRFWLVSATYD